MYEWRKMDAAEREETLCLRKQYSSPWRSPPHWDSESNLCCIVSAACYEHEFIAGKSPVRLAQLEELRAQLGRMYGRTSRQWNLEDDSVGRKVWFNCIERFIRNERHYWATINYIHHNPVKHGFVEKWDLWPFSSVAQYLDEIGRDKAIEIWKAYPVLDYGKEWDP